MDQSRKRGFKPDGKAYSVLPDIKKMDPRPPSGSKPERRSTRPRKINNKKPLPTIQGDNDPYDVVLRGVKFEELNQTEVVPRKMNSSSVLPDIQPNQEMMFGRGKSSPKSGDNDDSMVKPLRLASQMMKIPSIKKTSTRSSASVKVVGKDACPIKPLQLASQMKAIPSIPKKPFSPSFDSSDSEGDDDRTIKSTLFARDMKPVPPIKKPSAPSPGSGQTGGNVRRRKYKLA